LYDATGNPAFRDNLFIATRSGTIGGVAWNANQQILERYPDEYPKDAAGNLSVSKFSWLVGESNLAVIKPIPGTNRFLVPSEADLHKSADHATWVGQDLKLDGKLGDLTRTSPPGYLVSIDNCTLSVTSKIISGVFGNSLAIGRCYAIASIENPEAYSIANEALSRTNRQNPVSGLNDIASTGKVWLGQNIYDVAADLQARGVSFSVSPLRDLMVIKGKR
jgi:hypothetical protein